MGITIHYSGQLRDARMLGALIDSTREYSSRNNWGFALIPHAIDNLQGFVVHPHPECEPLEFRFGKRNRFASFVKTQFAGPEIHIQVVRLLRAIKPILGRLGVHDEGEYWETENEETLRWHINKVNELIESYKTENPGIQIRVKTPDGRIIDILE